MEDHKQPGKERKKRSDYFWDFFMLFLAVTAGFFIVNLRESLTEHKREKEFMHSLMTDLQKDADSITAYTQKRDLKNSQCDSLVNQLTTSPADNKAQIYFWGRMATRRNHFYPQDGALQQLKSSGGFRVIHNQRVLDEINAY